MFHSGSTYTLYLFFRVNKNEQESFFLLDLLWEQKKKKSPLSTGVWVFVPPTLRSLLNRQAAHLGSDGLYSRARESRLSVGRSLAIFHQILSL